MQETTLKKIEKNKNKIVEAWHREICINQAVGLVRRYQPKDSGPVAYLTASGPGSMVSNWTLQDALYYVGLICVNGWASQHESQHIPFAIREARNPRNPSVRRRWRRACTVAPAKGLGFGFDVLAPVASPLKVGSETLVGG